MVVSSAFEVLGDLRPAIAVDLMVLKNLVVFLHSPLHFLDVWIEVVVPSKFQFTSVIFLIGDFGTLEFGPSQIKYNQTQYPYIHQNG